MRRAGHDISPTAAAAIVAIGAAAGYAAGVLLSQNPGNARSDDGNVEAASVFSTRGVAVQSTSDPAVEAPDGPPPSGMMLVRLIRALNAVEVSDGHGLTPAQAKEILPVLTSIRPEQALPDDVAAAKLGQIQSILSPDQKAALEGLRPQRNPGDLSGFSGGWFLDSDHPFDSPGSRAALDNLLQRLGAR